jgi:hypothetical protein
VAKKKVSRPLTLQQKIDQEAARDTSIHNYAISRLPVPLAQYKTGDEVFFGNHASAVIVAVLDEGRRVAVSHAPASFAAPDRSEHLNQSSPEDVITVLPAIEVQLKSGESKKNFADLTIHALNYSQRDISGLLTIATKFGVEMDPPYQRDLVWDTEDKVKLIDSIFKHVDIGKFVFRRMPFKADQPSYEIVDGKQRLTAILDFMADKFSYRGKTWSQLSRLDRTFIGNYSVSYAQISESVPLKDIMEIFVRLNTGGKVVDPAHLARVAGMARGKEVEVKLDGPKP